MKRIFVFALCLLGCCVVLSAQNYNKKEVKSLQNFLNQPSAKEKPNHEQFKRINLNDPSTWEGVMWENGRVTAIDWREISRSIISRSCSELMLLRTNSPRFLHRSVLRWRQSKPDGTSCRLSTFRGVRHCVH